MLDLFLPYLLGLALGIEPPTAEPGAGSATEDVSAVEIDPGSGDDLATREPEPQVPTGKFTTAVEIKPIVGMTKSNWVAVRLYEGQDLLYFTHLLSWRCGIWDIRYGLNGAPADTVFPMEPCHEDSAQPNAMTDVANFLPYVALPPESIESVYVEITYDDGSTDFARFERGAVLIP
ncbi:hypothetical protein [Salibaculum griseiflavum]|uniref:Uncharacterized protein n=1 Tax=Salibaculum griseiflavum TaxID=1914409 RepID=A0A2V1P431_9RHOB|nr:hypothetical protein [Salibaculum griseiflavum]PWG17253.1 hypothetical protein DFK10_07650 [Salibaculum griseiflavum]